MSRFDHVHARRTEAERPRRAIFDHAGPGRRKARTVVLVDPATKAERTIGSTTAGKHRQGGQWWRAKAADLAEKQLAKRKAAA